MTEQTQTFTPNWVSPPGDTIDDLLEERQWTQAELAERTGFTRKHVNDLIKGRIPISAETAARLDRVLGGSVEFWLTREAQYRAALERQESLKTLKQETPWLTELPVGWLVQQGWIRRVSSKAEKVEECLRYFGVASVRAWRERYETPLVAFRAAESTQKKPGAIAAWLRQVEREADKLPCAPFDKAAFKQALPTLRALTAEPDPAVFVPKLQATCAACGVAVVFVPAPPGCAVHGATRWMSPEKAFLALTLRHKTNDLLWFTFFHEAAHLLKHGKKFMVIEGIDGLDPEHEHEADRFAADLLIPPSAVSVLKTLRSHVEISQMADQLGIAPGILVGRMQKEGWLPWDHLNALKVRYAWAESDAAPSDPAMP
ncbi:helix-turn-helix domain-containing protein [Thiocystis violacea]|uniref:helix-turn-helix domain-containing protein n=1 Tax=Thiocystis violacea TaxID=13725 RepID=UPI0019051577|nr:helix-turn-helix domain-containing protein [Thiocystis violacea]MBK1725061.1 XRE family transcriptional regulator [Thiocystis violacea]